jgi:Fe2+ or Zn2+ uptake regulation protein
LYREEENNLLRILKQEATVLSKCANPECSAPFLYFHRGKLFRVETEGRQDRRRQLGEEVGITKPMRRLEFYWLCENCAEQMTLEFDKKTGITVRARVKLTLARATATAAA